MQPPPDGAPAAERVALSQELSDFLIELSIALSRFAMYPDGHPALERAAVDVTKRLAALLQERASLSIGIARRQLVIEGVATDSSHPVLSGLATRLHRHRVGAISFHRGTAATEVTEVLRTLAVEPERADATAEPATSAKVRSIGAINLYPTTYDQLELIEQEEAARAEREDVRPAQLWVGLARAALAATDETPGSTEPAVVAEAINKHPQQAAYDQVIVGYLLQLAEELKQEGGTGTVTVRRRMARLIDGLTPATLRRLVEMGGDLTQRHKFVLDATQAFAAESVVEVVQAAAEASSKSISGSLTRLLSKLAANADGGTEQVRAVADFELREQVRSLVAGWAMTDPNPEAYAQALDNLSRLVGSAGQAQAYGTSDPLRVIQMALELQSTSALLQQATAVLVRQQRLPELAAMLRAVEADNPAAAALWASLATPERLTSLLAVVEVDWGAVDVVVNRLGDAAAPVLLHAVTESDSRFVRLGAIERLAALGAASVQLAAPYLSDGRWYVQRNVLTLFRLAGLHPQVPLAPFLRHPDPRVRREALKLLVTHPGERERAICTALTDDDQRNMRMALNAASDACPAAAVPLILNLLTSERATGEMRVQAIRTLRKVSAPAVLEALLRQAVRGKTWLGRPKLAPRSGELLEALSALATTWQAHPRVAPVLQHALASRDPEIRLAASGRKIDAPKPVPAGGAE